MEYTAVEILSKAFKKGGGNYVSNFPGFHSHEVFKKLGGKIVSTNEKVAYESAFGASLAGKRSLVTMKNVGLNVAADSFLHSMLSGVNGGLVLLVTDDVKVVGSQERMDSRHYRDFYGGLWFEPSSLEQLYDICKNSFTLSEELDIPIVIRLTNQILSRKEEVEGLKKQASLSGKKLLAKGVPNKYVVHPVYWSDQYRNLEGKNRRIKLVAKNYYSDKLRREYKNSRGVVVFGDCTDELSSIKTKDVDILNISTYPFPEKLVLKFFKNKKEVTIYEQGDKYGFKAISHILFKDRVKDLNIRSNTGNIPDLSGTWRVWRQLEHFFRALKSAKPDFVVSDVTQFTVESENVVDACLCLGAAIATGIGLSENGVRYPFCIVGDTSFLHGGYLAFKEALARNVSMGIVIVDNGGSWCTGGQETTFSIYDLCEDIPQVKVNYKDVTEKEIERTLLQMKNSGKLAVLYLKV